jgi:hypothetical protein
MSIDKGEANRDCSRNTIIRGLPCLSISLVSFRATLLPEIDVSGIAARHSTSFTTLRRAGHTPSVMSF